MAPSFKGFSANIQRRQVYRVGATYVIVGLGVLGAAELILDPLGLGAVRPTIVVLTLVGFPLTLLLAWVRKVPQAELLASPTDIAATSRETKDVERKSIAVLPFANLSSDPENEYFTDGMTEEIINAISNIPGLRVIARTSAFAFKGANRDIREIGNQLGVSTILEGTVRRTGQRVRITAQLIDVIGGGHQLWAERFDRHVEDVFVIQDEIARIIARRLQPSATRERRERPTENLDAYEAYLRGRFYFAKGTPDNYARSIEYFERAISLDPNFALAYAGIAETGGYWAFWSAPSDLLIKAKGAAQRALAIDQASAEQFAILGFIRFFHEWDWVGALDAFDRAVQLNPNSPNVLVLRCAAFANLGMEEAVLAGRQSLVLDPLSPQVNQTLGWALFQDSAFEDSIEYSKRAIELSPGYLLAFLVLGFALLESGALEEAEMTYRRMLEGWPTESMALAGLVNTYVRMGRVGDAREQLEKLEKGEEAAGQVAVSAAWSHAALGNMDAAFRWIDRAVESHESFIVCLPTFSWWDPLRADPRFEALLHRLGFPEWSYRQHGQEKQAAEAE